ncbi:MAG: HAD family phosphatase [Holdemanella sp.]|nr:HAD family phosphatase [Holdemanella sp.]
MLKNIVFDLGNVLVKFDSNELIYSFFNKRQEEVKSFYFDSLWNEYDQGLYSVEEMIEKGVKQFPELELCIKKLMYHWTEFVIPLKDNVAYIKDLKQLGFNVYILSNIPEDDTKYLRSLGVFDNIDGGIFSYEYKKIKPDPEIFHILLEKYNLKASECLFLDDRKDNVVVASNLGFKTIEVKDSSKVIDLIKEKISEV